MQGQLKIQLVKAIGLICSSSRLLLIFVRPNNQKLDPIVIYEDIEIL